MRVIMIGGYPGSGKSTIMKGAIAKLQKEHYVFEEKKFGLVRYMHNLNVIILGTYGEGEKFPGTDRLPMNVQPDAEEFLNQEKFNEVIPVTIIMEGDRLFNDKMIKFITDKLKVKLILCIVEAEQLIVEKRRNARSEQNEQWRKGRQTKVNRIRQSYPVHHLLKNNDDEEKEQSIQELYDEITGTWKGKEVRNPIRDLWS